MMRLARALLYPVLIPGLALWALAAGIAWWADRLRGR